MKDLPWRDFSALVISIGIVGLGLGATIPLTALALDGRGAGTFVIGLVTAASALGILGVAPFVTGWVARFGARATMMGAVCIAGGATVAMQLHGDVWLWCLLRALFGAAMGVLFTIGEAWVNRIAPDRSRGRVVALYTTSFTLFQLAGPTLVALLNGKLAWPFAACGLLFVAALPGLMLLDGTRLPADDEIHARWQDVLPHMPMIAMGAAFFALFDTLILALLPVYAMRQGIVTELALISATVVLVGDTALQFAMGALADRYGRWRVHVGCGVAVCLLLPLLPLAAGIPWLWWTLLLALGAVAGAIYMLALVACGERFSDASLTTASAIVNASWGIASAAGPLATGAMMHSVGINALPAVLFGMCALFLASAWWERRTVK
ncbi:MFS transporter [Pseudoduganella buxea]|uniref:MFS transporter n=1 Tax=Pseudoduganella buxea TaxID=1949069 RepID=A0A6I3SV37_9BURK|nr:MFS transporter [Pseudoduganella buxea]MTV52192.1 MFS transporter [Pseudoduganella buxea]GGB94370.1 MFS transporter [Pseudoduganella buxea]